MTGKRIVPMTQEEIDCLERAEKEFRAMHADAASVLGPDDRTSQDMLSTAEYVMHLRSMGIWTAQ